jgi:hypothetical protein
MTAIPWQPPKPGEIVWCRFPSLPSLALGSKPRPSLVFVVEVRDDGVAVQVAYGTSQNLGRLKVGEFAIALTNNRMAYALAGLSFDTKFDLKLKIDLPWTAEFLCAVDALAWPNADAGYSARVADEGAACSA